MESAPLGKETWQETLDAVFEGDVEQFGRLCTEQQIFEMKVMKELPYRAISEQTGIPTTTIYERYQQILLKIDQHGELRQYWEEMNNYKDFF